MISATITFKHGETPKNFTFWGKTADPWRRLANGCAVLLVPVCDDFAQRVESPSPYERVKIWPVRWGYPEELVTNHPKDVERMRSDHLAGKHAPIAGNRTFEYWLECVGKRHLWNKHRTPEIEREWLNRTSGAGGKLYRLSNQTSHYSGFKTVPRTDLDRIRFRADFHCGDACQTIYLWKCLRDELTSDEVQAERVAKSRGTGSGGLGQSKSHSRQRDGGRMTGIFYNREKEGAELARVMRAAKASFIKNNGTNRGANKAAYARGRGWWKTNHQGQSIPISDSTLRRVMAKNWRQGRKAKS